MNRLVRVTRTLLVGGLATLAMSVAVFGAAPPANPPEGVAVVIVYDTSGSMLQTVPDKDGRATPKHVIARRALGSVIDRLEAVAAAPTTSRVPLQAGLVVFRGSAAEFAVRFGPFDPQPFRNWLSNGDTVRAGTPLGDAVRVAGEAVLASKLPRKHVLVITDGMNTRGPEPTRTMPVIQNQAKAQETVVSFHVVAFDVNAKVFDGVKKLGATVVGASDEQQLNSQLEFILAKKILLEDEEVPATPK